MMDTACENINCEIITKGKTRYLHVNGFLFTKHSTGVNSKVYWRCRKRQQCGAKATTIGTGNSVSIISVGSDDSHCHAPDREEVDALRQVSNLKRAAVDQPECPPARILRLLQKIPPATLAKMPERPNAVKQIQRERMKEMPSNPLTAQDLKEIPDLYRNTNDGENFLLYDSYEDDSYSLSCGRIIVFATKENLKSLFRSITWFVDGTFKVVPSIFYQLFVIMGTMKQVSRGIERNVALPLVYALLESKSEDAYAKIFEIVISKAQLLGIQIEYPETVMSDFELGIINAAEAKIGNVVRLCLFHLCQNVYRRVQSEGLQEMYNSNNDARIREAMRTMCALAFVPSDDVPEFFDLFIDQAPQEFVSVAEYFEITYIRGKPARGRRRAIPARYDPALWNQYNAVIQKTARTNNASEGWHNRLQVVVGRYHPSLYTFLKELKQEQGDTECMQTQLNLGQKIRKLQTNKFHTIEERILSIVSQYQQYVDDNRKIDYLKTLGCHLHF
ncbi:uncharacterized protein LOC122500349 [Leptopilina heterotoma]|uniref:uncharacterized protein LOC122500349 n=1 Tax=Leptopilina heterotoma TaxID=63436 RepID=UPI001CA870A5|nr:uncharacterized protein LOC122500349 [Leptopilina heterotoma]